MVAEQEVYAEIEHQVWDCRGRAGSFLLLADDGGLGSRRRTVGFSDPIAKEEARARKEERAVAQLLRPM